MTAWEGADEMRRFVAEGAHRAAMPALLDWCDEASVVHWEQPGHALPSWPEADRRMRAAGRASAVRFPSPGHAVLDYPPPRVRLAGPIRPSRAVSRGPSGAAEVSTAPSSGSGASYSSESNCSK